MDPRVFGRNLRLRRHTCGWTQSELARRCDLTQHSISRYERGLRSPTTLVAQKLARCLGTTIESLLEEKH